MKIGAWAGMWSLGNPRDTTAIAKAVGLDFVNIMVNDHAADRFSTECACDNDRAENLAEHLLDAGIDIDFTSWIMPHRKFIETAAEKLIPLCEKFEASELVFDAEEPWTQARERLDYSDAAGMVAENFILCPSSIGLTGIVYTPRGKVKPLAGVCSFGIPQTYTTTRNKHNAVRLAKVAERRYLEDLALARIYPGFAAYSQNADTFAKQIATAHDDERVIFWHLRHIRNSTLVQDAIRGLTEHKTTTR